MSPWPGAKALRLAREVGNREVTAAAISTLGAATMFIDDPAGHRYLREALALAVEQGLHYIVANNSLGSACGELFHLAEAKRQITQAISFTDRHEIDVYRNYCISWLALCDMHLGDWEAAGDRALDIVQEVVTCDTSRLTALVALGRLRAARRPRRLGGAGRGAAAGADRRHAPAARPGSRGPRRGGMAARSHGGRGRGSAAGAHARSQPMPSVVHRRAGLLDAARG